METDLHFSTAILPLANLHLTSEQRKNGSRLRLEKSWGDNWETAMRGLLPPWPAESFLRELAVFSEQSPWAEAKLIFKERIKDRIAKPRTSKVTWLTNRDLVIGQGTKRKRGRVIREESSSPITPTVPAPIELSSSTASTHTQLVSVSSPATETHDSPSRTEPLAITTLKRRTISKNKKVNMKFKLAIPVVNLDVEERVEVVKKEVEQEQEMLNEVDVVGEALKVLARNGIKGSKISMYMWRQRVDLIMRVLMMEIVEDRE